MDKMTKASVIMQRLLEHGRFDWDWVDDAVHDAVITEGEGWNASAYLSETDRKYAADCDTVDVLLYYMTRRFLCYSVELTVDEEVVFSMRVGRGQPKVLVIQSGEWESEIFNLPKRQTKAAAIKEARQRIG